MGQLRRGSMESRVMQPPRSREVRRGQPDRAAMLRTAEQYLYKLFINYYADVRFKPLFVTNKDTNKGIKRTSA